MAAAYDWKIVVNIFTKTTTAFTFYSYYDQLVSFYKYFKNSFGFICCKVYRERGETPEYPTQQKNQK